MSVSSGQTYLAIPGPSVIPEAVLRSMHIASPNIYEGELIEITKSLIPDLNYVARSSGYVATYIANGHGIWEAALANMVSLGDHILVLATGSFAHGWAKMARKMAKCFWLQRIRKNTFIKNSRKKNRESKNFR